MDGLTRYPAHVVTAARDARSEIAGKLPENLRGGPANKIRFCTLRPCVRRFSPVFCGPLLGEWR